MTTQKLNKPFAPSPPSKTHRGAWLTCLAIVLLLAGVGWMRVPAHPPQPEAPAAAILPGMNLCDHATASPTFPGVMKQSEVVMRGLYPRPAGPADPYDTLAAIRGFHATHLEWTYALTAEFVRKVKALGVSVSGVTSTATGLMDPKSPDSAKKYGILDLNLNPTTASWMRTWQPPGLWQCVNNPAARASSLAQIKQQYDLGLRDLQRDDPDSNPAAVNWGGCFCPHCMAGFRHYLQVNCTADELRKLGVADVTGFDYRLDLLAKQAPVGDAFKAYKGGRLKELFRAFQLESTINFHKWWRGELSKHAGHYVPASCNNNGRDFTGSYEPFDFWIGELLAENNVPEYFFKLAQEMKRLGKGQTLTMPLAPIVTPTPEWIRQIRTAIAAVYATGLHIEAPWDTYLPAANAPRFFGDPKDFADLFAMVHATGDLLDGYEDVAATGMNLHDPRWHAADIPVSLFPAAAPVTAFVRAKPKSPDAALVIHLLDWSGRAQPFRLALRPERMFGGRPFRAVLVTPVPYQQQAHDAAFHSKNYEPLVHRTVLAEGRVASLALPALRPWGMVVLEPLPAAADSATIWPPTAWLDEQGRLCLASATAGADVRFTRDGSEPGANSPVFSTPLESGGKAITLRAVAAIGITHSAETVLPVAAASAWTQLLVNHRFANGLQGWDLPRTPPGLPPSEVKTIVATLPSRPGEPAVEFKMIRQASSAVWQLQFAQRSQIPRAAIFVVRATLECDRPATVSVGVAQINPPQPGGGLRTFELTPGQPLDVEISGLKVTDDPAIALVTRLGLVPEGATLWLARPSLKIWQP